MKNGKNTFLSCNVNTEIAFLLSSLFFSLIETYWKSKYKKKWTETGWIDWIKKRNVTFVSKHSCPCIYDSIESFFFLIKEI